MGKLRFSLAVILISLASYAAAQGSEPNQSFNPVATRTVSGTQIGHYKNGPVPVDLSVVQVAAYAPNGSGGYNVISGSGTSDGTFTIPDVPTGFYLLQLGRTYLATSNTMVNADSNSGYRSTGVPADENTTVTFDLTNLNPWQSTDWLEMVCPNNAAFNLFNGTEGETTFTGTFPYLGNLSDGSQGDQNFILQLITQRVGSYPFTALGRGILPPKFTQQQGSDTPINGRLTAIPQTHKFEANINGRDLTVQALAANPAAILIDTQIALTAYPGSLAKGQTTSTPDLVAYYVATGQPFLTTNGDLGPVFYGNPFPPSKWPLSDAYSWIAVVYYVAPGATKRRGIITLTSGTNTELPTSTSPIKPLVGVVTNPAINGNDFFADQTGIGLTPKLKWSPPSVGAATFYGVQIYQLDNNEGNTVRTLIASFRTPGRSLTIPEGLLTPGPGYVFVIRPWYVPGLNFAKTPYMTGPIRAYSDVVSGMMQP
ncbi:MAG: hypothetical protein LAO09_21735 [Acidobacteriia bacterium]|nr:hypothetical protein [Terriglobia bacterium]